MKDLEQARRELRRQLGREPEVQEIARALYAEDLENAERRAQTPARQDLSAEPESTRLLREKMDEVMAPLNPKERAILELRFGLRDNRPHTLEEVGTLFGISRQEIRQIEAKALKKLRQPDRSRWP